jgi:hypothetical protein
METISILLILCLFFMISIFLIEEKIIIKLREENKFKSWWRNHVIGDAKDMDI